MKKILLAFTVLLSLSTYAQTAGKDTTFNGIGKLQLGQGRKDLLPNLSYIPGSAFTRDPKNKGYAYNYSPASGPIFSIPGLGFFTAIVRFDEKNEVSLFQFVKIYQQKKDAGYVKAAKRDYKNLLNNLQHRFGSNGEAREYFKRENYLQSGTEWQHPGTFVKLALEENAANHTMMITLEFVDVPVSN